jgi:hypothetical protein
MVPRPGGLGFRLFSTSHAVSGHVPMKCRSDSSLRFDQRAVPERAIPNYDDTVIWFATFLTPGADQAAQ